MEMKFDVGATLDVASGAELRSATDSILGAKGVRPMLGRASGTITGNGSATLQSFVIGPPGGPGAGFVWVLDSITTFSQDDHTLYNPTPGTSFVGAVYVGGVQGSFPLSNLCLPGLTFPDTDSFPDGQWVRHGESVTVVLSATLATGQLLGANIWYRQFREADVTEMSGR